MKIAVPIDITDTRLVYSNVPEDDYPEYDDNTTYNTGDKVVVTTPNIHNIYEVVSETSITGVDPTTDASDPPKWLEVRKTNRWRMFDAVIGSKTTGEWDFDAIKYLQEEDEMPSLELDFVNQEYYVPQGTETGIALTITPDALTDTLAVFNAIALYAVVKVESLEGVIYQKYIPLSDELSESNWYAYFYQPPVRVDRFLLSDLPLDSEKQIHIAFVEPSAASPEVGEVIVGRFNEIGRSLYGTSLNFLDFSRKERDAFGNFQITERPYSDNMEVDFSIANEDITFTKNLISSIRAKPAIYIAGECIEATAVYGYHTDFSIVISGPERSDATITIEGLI